jgi:hypothetical protein
MKILNLISLFVILIISSCNNEDNIIVPTKKISNNKIVPLSIGNNWLYLSNDNLTVKPTISYSDERIAKDTIINNVKYFVLEKLFSSDKSFCYNDSLGYFQSSKDYNVNIKYPVQVGEVFYMNPFSDTVKVVSINQKITVPAGTFECIHYQSFDTFSRTDDNGVVIGKYLAKVDFYYSVGVGMVLTNISTLTKDSTTLHFKKELIEYTIKN